MTSPTRLSDDGGEADDLERAVLRCERDATPPEGARDAVWAKLSSHLGVADALGALTAVTTVGNSKLAALGESSATNASLSKGAVPAVSSGLTFIKGVLVGLLASSAVWQASRLLSNATPTPASSIRISAPSRTNAMAKPAERAPIAPTSEPWPSPQLATEKPSESLAGPVPERLEASPPPASAPSIAAFDDDGAAWSAPERRASQLKEEAQVLRQARAQLRAGAFGSALALLEASQRRFVAPALYQERESLMIELLFRSGKTFVASQRAEKFLAAFPESPHAARVRELGAR